MLIHRPQFICDRLRPSSRRNVLRNSLLQLPRLGVQNLQLFVEFFQPHCKFEVVRRPLSHTDVPPRIQAPTLRFDFIERGDLAEPEHIGVLALREALLHQVFASGLGLGLLPAIEPDDVGDELDLLRA